jgi:signal transduction histidine kinase/NO-binding membrane sensor protein with MHYT domain/ActR/RegA family two-component response regulator
VNALLASLATDHDPGFVAAGAGLALLGAASGFRLLHRAAFCSGHKQILLGLVGGAASGLGVWTSHYVTLLGWAPAAGLFPGADNLLGDLVIALLTFSLAGLLVTRAQTVAARLLSGLLVGGGLAAMDIHGLGHIAASQPGAWELAGLALAAGWVVALAAPAYLLQGSGGPWRRRFGALLLALAVTGGHHINLMALEIDVVTTARNAGGHGELMLTLISLCVAILMTMAVAVASVDLWSRNGALRQLRHAIDAMPDGLAFYDANDRLQLWNVRYAELVGNVSGWLKEGMPYSLLLERAGHDAEWQATAEWRAKRLEGRKQLGATMEQRLADGRWIRIQDRRTADGGMVTVVSDITDLKQAAESLAAARDAAEEANRAKSQFLANMSHEIRTPLNGVIGVAQALGDTPLNARQTEMLELIRSSGATLQTLLSDILDLARVESGRLCLQEEPMSLARAVREAAELYEASAHDKGLQFYVEIAPEADVWINADVVRLKQILTNLVSNAVKFTEAGFVSLRVSRSPEGDPEPTLRFSVEDTGLGFDADTRSRLFARFEQADGSITRRYGGTGLGLAICRQLADMMGGTLDCESEPGGGSAFFLTVPLKLAEAPAEPVTDRPEIAADLPHLSVLVADDHPVNRRVVELILDGLDVDITSAEDGLQALASFAARRFDLVLMDMQMPLMDGLAATAAIRTLEAREGRPRTPVVMLTANALPEHVQAAAAAGADRHLAKPFSAPELIGMVAELVTREAEGPAGTAAVA